jgi:hypothetical protein
MSAGPSGRAVCGVGLDRLEAETMGPNPVEGMDDSPQLFVIIHLLTYHRSYWKSDVK